MEDKRCLIKPHFPRITYSKSRLSARTKKCSRSPGAISKFQAPKW